MSASALSDRCISILKLTLAPLLGFDGCLEGLFVDSERFHLNRRLNLQIDSLEQLLEPLLRCLAFHFGRFGGLLALLDYAEGTCLGPRLLWRRWSVTPKASLMCPTLLCSETTSNGFFLDEPF